jgi:DNA mismatch repair ATPase MutS
MKVYLMHPDRDFDLRRPQPPNAQDLISDLELRTLWDAMAGGDKFLLDIAARAVLQSLTDIATIRYRQDVLADCLAQPAAVRELYDLAVSAIEGEKSIWGFLFSKSPESVLSRAVNVLDLFVDKLTQLRRIADEQTGNFASEGFRRFFALLSEELEDDYFHTIQDHLKELKFRGGTLMSADLGNGLKSRNYVLRKPWRQSWKERLSLGSRSGYSFQIPDRDDNGARALSELRDRGLNLVANALAQSTDHILSFFRMIRAELAFYIGCLNLHVRLHDLGELTCVPIPAPFTPPAFCVHGLYDVCLALHTGEQVVGNDVDADGRRLVMITGANQGGKSTFLRSDGLAQLMMQCGMFVAAESFRSGVCQSVFTHYKREEDATMESGKLDEELSRMSGIAGAMTSGSLLLCNESFASTNEREGSEIARQIVRASVESGIAVFYVTHLFDLAHGLYSAGGHDALFLRAERRDDGSRTFRLVPGEPLPTSYGEDLYARVFGADLQTR